MLWNRLALVVVAMCTISVGPACSLIEADDNSDMDPYRTRDFEYIDVGTTGPVVVSFTTLDGTPTGSDNQSPNATRQSFELRDREPVVATFVITESATVRIGIEVFARGGSLLGPAEKTVAYAQFVLDEPAQSVATLQFSRDSDFTELRVQVDRDGDGTIDVALEPTETLDEE